MFTIKSYVKPCTIEEAYALLKQKKNAAVIGGCAYLRMGSKMIDPAIDLSKLGLNQIEVEESYIRIGAEVTFGDLENASELEKRYSGLLREAVQDILGVQFRNMVKVGPTVYSRYGFSDLNTALLALGGQVHFASGQKVTLETYLEEGLSERDILTHVELPSKVDWSGYQALRNSKGDYALLTMAGSRMNGHYRIAVGARPMRSKLAVKTMAFLDKHPLTPETLEKGAEILAEEMVFGSNRLGSASYRKQISQSLFKDLLKEAF